MPFSNFAFFANIDISLLFIFAVSGLAVYGIILSG
jgi:NADH:ubiquinone oxidoreductase subunit H